MKLLVLGVVVGASIMWGYANRSLFSSPKTIEVVKEAPNNVADFKAENETIEDDADDVEAKVDEIKESGVTSSEVSEDCDPKTEKSVIDSRVACHKQDVKAVKYWKSLEVAEKAVVSYITSEQANELMNYTSCDALDLTWYEMHCEADRETIELVHYKALFKLLKEYDLSSTDGRWVRKKPNKRKIINPRWVERSRLVLRGFKLQAPWNSESHPTENEVIILLEEKLDGKVYIVGLPVTGLGDED